MKNEFKIKKTVWDIFYLISVSESGTLMQIS